MLYGTEFESIHPHRWYNIPKQRVTLVRGCFWTLAPPKTLETCDLEDISVLPTSTTIGAFGLSIRRPGKSFLGSHEKCYGCLSGDAQVPSTLLLGTKRASEEWIVNKEEASSIRVDQR